jgi:hypothetical protein
LRLFIDESLSPDFALRLNDLGKFDAIHPLHVGRRGEPDHRVLAREAARPPWPDHFALLGQGGDMGAP